MGVSWDLGKRTMTIIFPGVEVLDSAKHWKPVHIQREDHARRLLGVGDHIAKLRQLVGPECHNVVCLPDAPVVDKVVEMLARGKLTLFEEVTKAEWIGTYQGIIDKAITKLAGEFELEFYQLDAAFGAALVEHAKQGNPPPGVGGPTGWLRKDIGPLFKQVGAKRGLYGMVIRIYRNVLTKEYKLGHFIALTAVHDHTVIGGVSIPGNFTDSLEIYGLAPDWEQKVATAQKNRAPKQPAPKQPAPKSSNSAN